MRYSQTGESVLLGYAVCFYGLSATGPKNVAAAD